MTKTLKNSGAGEDAIKQSTAQIPKTGTPAELQLWVGRNGLKSLEASEHLNRLFPATQMISTGAGTMPVTTGGALAVQTPGQQAGPMTEAQLPPSTQVVSPTGASTYLGSLSERQKGPIQAGVGPATANLQANLGTTLGSDWTSTSQKASEAPQKIALYQNIKKLIPESYTGALADKNNLLLIWRSLLEYLTTNWKAHPLTNWQRIPSSCNLQAAILMLLVDWLSLPAPTPR